MVWQAGAVGKVIDKQFVSIFFEEHVKDTEIDSSRLDNQLINVVCMYMICMPSYVNQIISS